MSKWKKYLDQSHFQFESIFYVLCDLFSWRRAPSSVSLSCLGQLLSIFVLGRVPQLLFFTYYSNSPVSLWNYIYYTWLQLNYPWKMESQICNKSVVLFNKHCHFFLDLNLLKSVDIQSNTSIEISVIIMLYTVTYWSFRYWRNNMYIFLHNIFIIFIAFFKADFANKNIYIPPPQIKKCKKDPLDQSQETLLDMARFFLGFYFMFFATLFCMVNVSSAFLKTSLYVCYLTLLYLSTSIPRTSLSVEIL